ncbi:MAG: CobW-like GTP-binding protein [Pseudomonas sp.]|nr:CobW-like GTP-binding protein [Pseudomonas sp.]
MLQNIPTHVIAGPLGAGKTSLIRQLMAQRPVDERWAVLINEFGQIGLDAALLATDDDGIALGEVAGGCLCCVNGAPFQVGLGRLLRKATPDRLFIEPSGLGHPATLMQQLQDAPWRGVLAVQPAVMVLDAQALACGKDLPASQQEALADAGMIVLNKAEHLEASQRLWIESKLPTGPLYWTDYGRFPLQDLPHQHRQPRSTVDNFTGESKASSIQAVWADPAEPICLWQDKPEGWSIGWRWHPSRQFAVDKLEKWLATMDWKRAKFVVHSPSGWVSINAVDNHQGAWKPSEWRRDSRLELIFKTPQAPASLQKSLRACLLANGG